MKNLCSGEVRLLKLLERIETLDGSLQEELSERTINYLGTEYQIRCHFQGWGDSYRDGERASSITMIQCKNQSKYRIFNHKFKIMNCGNYKLDEYTIIENEEERIEKNSSNQYEPEMRVGNTIYGNNYIKKDGYLYRIEEGKIVQYKDTNDFCSYDYRRGDLFIHNSDVITTLWSLKEFVSKWNEELEELRKQLASHGMLTVEKEETLIKLEKQIEEYEKRSQALLRWHFDSFRKVTMKVEEDFLNEVADDLAKVIEQLEEKEIAQKVKLIPDKRRTF